MPTTIPLASDRPNIQTIHLADLGPDISGRGRGEGIRTSLEAGAQEVIFDCAGIDSMSPSFADEVFGKLAELPQRPAIKVINASPEVLSLIRFAVQERAGA